MSSNNNNGSSSTVKSYVDQAVGTAQSAIGSVTGNNQNKVWAPIHIWRLFFTNSLMSYS